MLIDVITGTTREGRFSQRVALWVLGHLEARGDLDVELLDLREHPLPFFDAPSPARTPREYRSEEVARFGRTIDRADGYVVLTGEYNHGYPAVLKNAMDWTFVEWRRKPGRARGGAVMTRRRPLSHWQWSRRRPLTLSAAPGCGWFRSPPPGPLGTPYSCSVWMVNPPDSTVRPVSPTTA